MRSGRGRLGGRVGRPTDFGIFQAGGRRRFGSRGFDHSDAVADQRRGASCPLDAGLDRGTSFAYSSPRHPPHYYGYRPLPPRRARGHRPLGAARPSGGRGAPAPWSRRIGATARRLPATSRPPGSPRAPGARHPCAAFLRWRGQHALGFARLGDFARERLGLSARELQALARVAECLARLAPVAAAFERGELTWTQVRLLAGVATTETAEDWVAFARGRTVRASAEDWVAFARGRTVRALEGMIAHRTGKPVEHDDTIEGEPRVHFRLRCPQRVRQRWHELTVLARCVMGSEVAPWHVADAVAAEGFSARDIVPDDPFAGLPDPPPGAPPVDLWETRAVFGPIDWDAVEE